LTFDSWKGPQEICDQCILTAAVRDSMDLASLDLKIGQLKEKYHADIRKLESPNLDISSHNIRSWRKEGRSIRYYVPDAVVDYILNEGIYVEL
jgi:nicotinate-nucleotide adenylyltransferase